MSQIAQIHEILNNKDPALALEAYHAAKKVRNANRMIGIERRINTMKKALWRFNVIVSHDITGAIRIYCPETNKSFILE